MVGQSSIFSFVVRKDAKTESVETEETAPPAPGLLSFLRRGGSDLSQRSSSQKKSASQKETHHKTASPAAPVTARTSAKSRVTSPVAKPDAKRAKTADYVTDEISSPSKSGPEDLVILDDSKAEGPSGAQRRRKRAFNDEQFHILEEAFAKNPKPGDIGLGRLSKTLGVNVKNVRSWFATRRTNQRNKSPSSLANSRLAAAQATASLSPKPAAQAIQVMDGNETKPAVARKLISPPAPQPIKSVTSGNDSNVKSRGTHDVGTVGGAWSADKHDTAILETAPKLNASQSFYGIMKCPLCSVEMPLDKFNQGHLEECIGAAGDDEFGLYEDDLPDDPTPTSQLSSQSRSKPPAYAPKPQKAETKPPPQAPKVSQQQNVLVRKVPLPVTKKVSLTGVDRMWDALERRDLQVQEAEEKRKKRRIGQTAAQPTSMTVSKASSGQKDGKPSLDQLSQIILKGTESTENAGTLTPSVSASAAKDIPRTQALTQTASATKRSGPSRASVPAKTGNKPIDPSTMKATNKVVVNATTESIRNAASKKRGFALIDSRPSKKSASFDIDLGVDDLFLSPNSKTKAHSLDAVRAMQKPVPAPSFQSRAEVNEPVQQAAKTKSAQPSVQPAKTPPATILSSQKKVPSPKAHKSAAAPSSLNHTQQQASKLAPQKDASKKATGTSGSAPKPVENVNAAPVPQKKKPSAPSDPSKVYSKRIVQAAETNLKIRAYKTKRDRYASQYLVSKAKETQEKYVICEKKIKEHEGALSNFCLNAEEYIQVKKCEKQIVAFQSYHKQMENNGKPNPRAEKHTSVEATQRRNYQSAASPDKNPKKTPSEAVPSLPAPIPSRTVAPTPESLPSQAPGPSAPAAAPRAVTSKKSPALQSARETERASAAVAEKTISRSPTKEKCQVPEKQAPCTGVSAVSISSPGADTLPTGRMIASANVPGNNVNATLDDMPEEEIEDEALPEETEEEREEREQRHAAEQKEVEEKAKLLEQERQARQQRMLKYSSLLAGAQDTEDKKNGIDISDSEAGDDPASSLDSDEEFDDDDLLVNALGNNTPPNGANCESTEKSQEKSQEKSHEKSPKKPAKKSPKKKKKRADAGLLALLRNHQDLADLDVAVEESDDSDDEIFAKATKMSNTGSSVDADANLDFIRMSLNAFPGKLSFPAEPNLHRSSSQFVRNLSGIMAAHPECLEQIVCGSFIVDHYTITNPEESPPTELMQYLLHLAAFDERRHVCEDAVATLKALLDLGNNSLSHEDFLKIFQCYGASLGDCTVVSEIRPNPVKKAMLADNLPLVLDCFKEGLEKGKISAEDSCSELVGVLVKLSAHSAEGVPEARRVSSDCVCEFLKSGHIGCDEMVNLLLDIFGDYRLCTLLNMPNSEEGVAIKRDFCLRAARELLSKADCTLPETADALEILDQVILPPSIAKLVYIAPAIILLISVIGLGDHLEESAAPGFYQHVQDTIEFIQEQHDRLNNKERANALKGIKQVLKWSNTMYSLLYTANGREESSCVDLMSSSLTLKPTVKKPVTKQTTLSFGVPT